MNFLNLLSILLLIFVPLSVAADFLDWGSKALFITSALAIIPLSLWLSTATEKIAVVTGPSIGGLINAVFGNTTLISLMITATKQQVLRFSDVYFRLLQMIR